MKKFLPFILLILSFLACSKPVADSKTAKLEKVFQHLYTPEREGITSLSLEVSGNHDIVKNFLADLGVDSGKILVYWQAPFDLKTHIFTATGKPVILPRWLDFGFAFGIFYGTELVPIFSRSETEIKLLEQEFNLLQAGMVEEKAGENNTIDFKLNDPGRKQQQQTIVTDKNYFPLNTYGTRQFEGDGQELEIGYSKNWLRLPNNKAVTSFKQQSVNDKSRKRLEYRISYKKIAEYWFPSEILERRRASEKGRIQRQDTRLVYENYQINPQLPEDLFLFEAPGTTNQNFSTPDSTIRSLLAAVRVGNTNQMKICFSKEMESQFEALTNQASQGITPFAIIPGEMLRKIQNDVTIWVFQELCRKNHQIDDHRCQSNQSSGDCHGRVRRALFPLPRAV